MSVDHMWKEASFRGREMTQVQEVLGDLGRLEVCDQVWQQGRYCPLSASC